MLGLWGEARPGGRNRSARHGRSAVSTLKIGINFLYQERESGAE